MEMAASTTVYARNRIGQFRAACERAATATVEKAIERGASLSREFAPVGVKHDARTIPLKDSIEAEMTGATSGNWTASARHALPQEFGAAPHFITGDVTFFWESEGRDWAPGSNVINHPGNPAQPYLRPAYEIIMGEIMEIAREEYPG